MGSAVAPRSTGSSRPARPAHPAHPARAARAALSAVWLAACFALAAPAVVARPATSLPHPAWVAPPPVVAGSPRRPGPPAPLPPATLAADDVQVLLDKHEALAAVFPEADRVLEVRRLLSATEGRDIGALARRELEEGGFYTYRATRDGRLVGYAVVVSQVGKVRPITHMVGVTPDGRVGRVVVMIYRESHGGEVAAERFLAQYRGLSLDDPLRIDADIVNIAGATLSGHAICRGVRKALAVVDVLWRRADAEALAELLVDAQDVTPEALRDRDAARAPFGESVRWDAGGSTLRVERHIMGSLCAVELRAEDERTPPSDTLLAAARAALDEVQRWDAVLSDWRDDTPLSRLNAAPSGAASSPGSELLAWLEHARWAASASGGAFDPAVGALVSAWRLRTQEPSRPTSDALAAAVASSGLRWLDVDMEAGTVASTRPGVLLDPGASGKGWALDRAAEVLRAHGVTRALLSFRSTLLALDPPPGERAWSVPVVHDGSGRVVARVELVDEALSVSGGSLSAFVDGGVERGHVIDPTSGVPVPAARLAWVTHASAATADALSTALLVAGDALPPIDGAQGFWLADADARPSPWPALR